MTWLASEHVSLYLTELCTYIISALVTYGMDKMSGHPHELVSWYIAYTFVKRVNHLDNWMIPLNWLTFYLLLHIAYQHIFFHKFIGEPLKIEWWTLVPSSNMKISSLDLLTKFQFHLCRTMTCFCRNIFVQWQTCRKMKEKTTQPRDFFICVFFINNWALDYRMTVWLNILVD